jgi:ribose-phosphate pyrophosphokinase
MPNDDLRIFAGSSSRGFTEGMCLQLGVSVGASQVFSFSEGNTYVKILENVRRKDVYIVQTIGTKPNDAFMELLFWIDAFKRASANSVTVIMPFFSYAKGDKKDEPRVSIRARVCADCLESAGADRIITMDLHSPQIQGFFKIPVDHLFSYSYLCEYLSRTRDLRGKIVVSPDAGFSKPALRYSEYLGLPLLVLGKSRADHSETPAIYDINCDIKGAEAWIVDDFAISCGTLIETARLLEAKGAAGIKAIITHNVLTERGVAALDRSPIEEVITTDTVHNEFCADSSKVTLVSVTSLFAEAVSRIHTMESVSDLFTALPPSVLDTLPKKGP